jgi:phosphoribosyl-ATP pyrophosphohydrolase/phosphoribosyl-AMP cyclohydrolase
MTGSGLAFLSRLEQVIESRKAAPAEQSYTATLLAAGRLRIAQKVAEEAVELALASVGSGRDQVVAEAADLVYHLLVLLRNEGIELSAVVAELESRHR